MTKRFNAGTAAEQLLSGRTRTIAVSSTEHQAAEQQAPKTKVPRKSEEDYFSKRISLAIKGSQYDALKEYATDNGMGLNAAIRMALQRFLKDEGKL